MTTTSTDKQDWLTRADHKAVSPSNADLIRAMEEGRGREAEAPSHFPFLGWKDILTRVLWSIPSDRLFTLSGGAAFFTLLAIFPAIATVVSLCGLIADRHTVVDQVNLLYGILPPGVLDLIRQQILFVVDRGSDELGLAFVVSTSILLWSANSGVSALFDGLNVIYGEKEKRSLVRFYATTLVITVGSIFFLVLALAGVVVMPATLHLFRLPAPTEIALQILTWPVLLIALSGGLSILYRVGPSRQEAKWRWLSWGSAMAAILWLLASITFSTYVASFDSYNRIYGSLGAVVGFMTWIWISIFIVLLGAKFNAEMEHQTAQDTTRGRPAPLGERGANVADHVGASVAE